MSVALISGGLRLRVVFFCTRGLAGHVARIVMELSRRLFTRLLLIWKHVAPLVWKAPNGRAKASVVLFGLFLMQGNVEVLGSFLCTAVCIESL